MSMRKTSRDTGWLAQEWQVGTYEWWPAAGRLTWSPELVQIYGLDHAPPAESGFSDLVHPEDSGRVDAETAAFLGSDATSYSRSFRIVRPDGAVRAVLDRGAVERDPAGKALLIRGISIDVTDDVRRARAASPREGAVPAADAHDSLRDRETQLQLAMQAALAIVFEWDIRADRVVRIMSDDTVLPATGDRPGTFEEVAAAIHPDDRATFCRAVEAALASGDGRYRSEHRIAGPDGAVRWIAESGRVEFGNDGRPLRLVGISHDVTERRRAEQELAEANALLESLFDNAPVGLGVWDSEFRFLRINRELAAINGLPPEAHIGRRPDEILPDIADLDEVYRNWRRLLATGEPWRGVEISGETPAQPGRLRHWQEDFFPVRIGDRNVGLAAIVQETTLRKAAQEQLRASKERYRALFDAIDEGFCVVDVLFDGPDGRIDYRVVEANPAFYERTGFPQAILGRWLREAAPELEDHWYEIYGRVARTGEPTRFQQHSAMLGRWFDVYAFRIDAPSDRHVAILFDDISDQKRQEAQTELLMREVNHRAKNLLSLVQAIARLTARSGTADFLDEFGKRLQALAASQDLLVHNGWASVPADDLVRAALGHFSDLIGNRIDVAGPPLSLTADATQALGMALHELATNAAKYGALSNGDGHVAVAWSVGPDASCGTSFRMSWTERGGPRVAEPERRGFGSAVTVEMVEASTGGTVSADYAPGGFCWTLVCPSANVSDVPLPRGSVRRAAPAAGHGEDGRRSLVLVVEDEPLLATETASLLADAGFALLGPAGSVGEALSLLARQGCDAAVLDMNLGHETSEPVARRLIETGIPFIVVSGYSKEQLPPAFRAAPLVAKPLEPGVLEAELRNVLAGVFARRGM